MTPPFEAFIKNPYKGRLITFDPGETTGWALWDNALLIDCGQLPTHRVKDSIKFLKRWIDDKTAFDPTKEWESRERDQRYAVMEEYRVYAHKTEDHAQNTMHTSRLIGALECLLTLRGIGYEMRGAGLAKKWATDEKLKDWGFYVKGERHARDAIRHGCYFYHHGLEPGK